MTAGKVGEAKDASQDPLERAATDEPGPGRSPRQPGSLTEESPGARPGSVRAARAMPPPRTESEIDFRPDTIRTENILKEACVTREFMEQHDDPELKAGVAAQDSLKNLLGSLMIFMDQPYTPGQRIVVEGHDGFVEQIGLSASDRIAGRCRCERKKVCRI